MDRHIPQRRGKLGKIFVLSLNPSQGPWVCLGDFNYIVNAKEKYGGVKGGTSTSNYLKEIMFDLGAIDLGYSGNKFTWAKGRWGSAAIKERLDKGLASISWRLVFTKASVQHLGALNADHLPILLDTNLDDCFSCHPFRFEAAWIQDERCQEVIEQAWNTEMWVSQLSRLCKKQATTREALLSPNSFLGVVSARNKEDNELDSLRMLITLEAIWFIRNQLLHNAIHIDIMEASQLIKKRTLEYAKTLSKEKTISKDKSVNGWEAPEDGWIKINVDAAVTENATALLMVARNKNGEVRVLKEKSYVGYGDCLALFSKCHAWYVVLFSL
nr:hypothetical protein CFP56_26200 [Quercus suber]